jgi:hypothetical protein
MSQRYSDDGRVRHFWRHGAHHAARRHLASTARIASPEMFPEAEMLPHLICSRPMFIGGAKDEADQHGGA